MRGCGGAVARAQPPGELRRFDRREWRHFRLKITAGWALGAWIMFQIVMAFMPTTGELTPTAWWAHIGGLLAGALLVVVMRRPGTQLFGR